MTFPASTGQAARFLGVAEPRLNDLIRRRKLNPEPPIVAGRRLWSAAHVYSAGRALDLLTVEIRQILEPLLSADPKATV